MNRTYDAFLSYSHAEDRGVARRLQGGVEKFAKPWYRVRALRVFLDTNSLSANPGLWSSVESALAASSWFVLVTSPRAADSPWVEREIRWWLENRSADRLLIVVSDGTLRWDQTAGDFDAAASTALPPALLGALDEEPRWVTVPPAAAGNPEVSELDLQETVIDVATAIRGIPKEELAGVAAREHRRTMRWVRGTIAVLTILLVAAVIAGLVALSQRSAAVDQAQVALSRQVASASREAAGRNLSVSMLLAVAAYKQKPNPQTRAALFAANTASPYLERFLDAGGKVERLAGTAEGAVVAGLADGRVLLWPEGVGEPRELFRLERRVSSLAISRDGTAIAAAAEDAPGLLWREGRGPSPLTVPRGQHADAVALSPSGETLAYHAEAAGYEGAESVTVASTTRRAVHSISRSGITYVGSLVLPSDERLLIFGAGSWEWRRISDWKLLNSSSGLFGAHQYADARSADGRFFTVTNGAKTVPVWSTAKPGLDLGESDLGVEAPITDQSALALSPDGGKIAVAGSEGVYVAPVMPAQDGGAKAFEAVESSDPASRPLQLTGQVGIGYGLLAFPGDDSRLLSASGPEIAIWDLEQGDRLVRSTVTVPLDPPCNACEGASLAVSPDGHQVAVVDGYGSTGFVQNLQGSPERKLLPESPILDYSYGQPVWQGDSEFVAFPLKIEEGSEVAPFVEIAEGIRAWPGAVERAKDMTSAMTADGETAMLANSEGDVYWQDVETGEVLRESQGPDSLSPGIDSLEAAALDSSPELLAALHNGEVTVEDLSDRQVVGSFKAGKFAHLAFAGDRLLVQRQNGALEVWDERGTALQKVIPGDVTFDRLPVGNADGSLVARRRSDGSVALVDLVSGAQLAGFGTREASTFLRTSVAFSPDGESLYMLSEVPGEEHRAELVGRDVSDEALVEATCDAAGRELSEAEWRAFIGTEAPSDLSCP